MPNSDEREEFRSLEQHFAELSEAPPDERERLLITADARSPGLGAKLRALLDAHDAESSPVDLPAVPRVHDTRSDTPLEGRTLGEWRIVRLIAEGGWADVYEAVQSSPARSCAIKVLRGPWMAATRTSRRFREEAELLGRMNHAGIAHVYGAGVQSTPDGDIAYLAMELIEGAIPITEFARTRSLSRRERLALFLDVADAVSSAHQRGVLHRDLKPSNILVGADRRPRVIDFGIARSLNHSDNLTRAGEIIGTLGYISPEQLADPIACADVRSDVYSLGVILYELTTERLPLRLPSGIADAARVIREVEPLRPRAADPSVDPDLETVILAALEKDPARRYQSVAALLADVRNVLEHRPIHARPVPALRRLSLAARRRPSLTFLAAAATLAAVAAIALGIRGYRAESRQRVVSESVLDILDTAMTSARANRKGDEVRVTDLIASIDSKLAGEPLAPEARAKLHEILGRTHENLGNYPQALSQYKLSLEIARSLWTKDHPLILQLEIELAGSLYDAGDPLASAEALRLILNSHSGLDPLVRAKINNDLAVAFLKGGEPALALAPGLDALRLRSELTGENSSLTLQTRVNVGAIYMRRAQFDLARDQLHAAVSAAELVGPETRALRAHARTWLGFSLANLGEAEESARQCALARQDATAAIGENHPTFANLMGSWAESAELRGDLLEARELASSAALLADQLLGPTHPDALAAQARASRLLPK